MPGGTLRENVHAKPGQRQVMEDHPAAKYRRERLERRQAKDLEKLKLNSQGKVNGETSH